ncbi:MAG: DJ-1/PfpI family protein [Oscillospiraceae bacterium]|nr:DJ-1/PfpI family protein [Oscillospiraceae bacterium]
MIAFNVLLFEGFETLDAFGPVEIISKLPKIYKLDYFSINGGIIISSQQISVNTLPFSAIDTTGVLLIPGGLGTRKLIDDIDFINSIKLLSQRASHVLTVCTGSALLAKTGLLHGKKATSNKMAFDWVCSNGNGVNWTKKARWANDDKYYTSSGVSAGMDMTLGFICDIYGEETAQDICKYIEYIWNRDKDNDPFDP